MNENTSLRYQLVISSAALHGRTSDQNLWEILQGIFPDADISTSGGALVKSFELPAWVVVTQATFDITAAGIATTGGIYALVRFVQRMKERYPQAPPTSLRLIDGQTHDEISLDGIDTKVAEAHLKRWEDEHRPKRHERV